ncbi:MAG TPA: 23S rRNA (pseudouridine(1915)-N(3))-methyltransferase RlmH, partial [Puia sp.]|nr:23S rRNA (pseudouridine(1915)-N(3))-methyltransferase RlmH [Puia sp.]
MKIQLWSIGKSHDPSIKAGIDDFTKRIGRYFPVEWTLLPPLKNAASLPPGELKKKEGEALRSQMAHLKDFYLVSLDENGKQLSSEGLARFLQGRTADGGKDLVFLVGG